MPDANRKTDAHTCEIRSMESADMLPAESIIDVDLSVYWINKDREKIDFSNGQLCGNGSFSVRNGRIAAGFLRPAKVRTGRADPDGKSCPW